MKAINILISISIIGLLMSCGGSSQKNNEQGNNMSGDIKIDGSSTVYPITEAVAEEFREIEPDIRVTIGVSGTGGGFKKFARNETDISNASRPIKDIEKETCEEHAIHYHSITIAYDGLAVVINPENTWAESITVEELKKIWEPSAQNKITHWNQIRPEWPNEEIHLFGPGIASGTYDYFTEAIVGKSGSSRGDFTASEDDNVLVQGVATDKYSLGFFGLAYFEENSKKLKLVAVDNGNGPVKPTAETVSNNSYDPLSRPIFIYVNQKSCEREEVQKFVKFYIKNAGSLTKDVGYVALPTEKYDTEYKKFISFLETHKL
ncbi:MAG: PstS family phosphate ABC transporter substrate-binding protein [Bacteroidales bacterium]|jgi:phosphate transport system substrate-binding protein|nr:PstS family phosphate ABC transporter substrate-binding protein [Bacteroidales bacterium]